MFGLFTRKPRIAYAAGAAAVGVSAGGVYYFSKRPRNATPNTDNLNTPFEPSSSSSSSTDGTPLSNEPNSEDDSLTQDPEKPPELEPPIVYASRVLTNRLDPFQQAESSMIVDDKSVGFSRSDSLVISESVEGYNSWSWAGPRALSLFMLFQAHNGSNTSTFLRDNFLSCVIDHLTGLFARYDPMTPAHTQVDETSTVPSGIPPSEEVCDTLTQAFRKMDDDIVNYSLESFYRNPSKRAVFDTLTHAQTGSSALVSFFESETRMLRVAHVGASRAVLGRRTGQRYKGQMMYEAIPLSSPHTPSTPCEQQRLADLHPGEDISSLLSSHPVTRSFGDAAFKWSADVQQKLAREWMGEEPHPNLKTPPYLTPDPEIYSVHIQPGDFLIIASDGLWDTLSPDEAIGLVGWFINNLDAKRWSPPRPRSTLSEWNKYSFDMSTEPNEVKRPDQLPVHSREVSVGEQEDETVYYKRWNAEKKFVNVDANAATHLTRNALGGADKDVGAAVLEMVSGSKAAKRFKPELGVTVVFFNDISEEDENS